MKELVIKHLEAYSSKSFCHLIPVALIDEYQDFSLLFSELISTIRRYNKDVRIFCVGDDWQAINGFAGSSTKYFYQFEE